MTEASDYYRNKVAIVTGAASGIGLALADVMLAYGAGKLVLSDINDANLSREVDRLDRAHPGKVLGVHCDVSKELDVQKMVQRAADFGAGRIDFLFNNAGAGFGGAFDELTDDDWEQAFALNFYGPLYGIRAVLPVMRAQGSGHVVDVISGIAFFPMAYQTRYAATKAALNGLTLALRYELWDEGIRFTSATPGTTVTAIWGEKPPPEGAQSAEDAARHVLSGVARNERLVLGDANDARGVRSAFQPEAAAGVDEYLLDVARKRRAGEWVV